MRAFYAATTAAHSPQQFILRGRFAPNEERAERAERLLAGLDTVGLSTEEPPDAGAGSRASVHSWRYLDFLERAYREWRALERAGEEVIASAHPQLAHPSYPTNIVGRAGWHASDAACPIGPDTFDAACRAADCAVAAADAIAGGAGEAYALARPPGHHAGRETAGGHCFINNAAIAAERLCAGGARVAILDIDVHHGNGTQQIFYDRGDVLFVSVHGDPGEYYPWFWGYAHEAGAGAGEGATLNLPLARGADDPAWLAAIATGLGAIERFGADRLVLSLGLDAHALDPLAFLNVSTEGFGRAGSAIARAGLPTAIVQEGGYISPALGDNLAAFLQGFLDGRRGST